MNAIQLLNHSGIILLMLLHRLIALLQDFEANIANKTEKRLFPTLLCSSLKFQSFKLAASLTYIL